MAVERYAVKGRWLGSNDITNVYTINTIGSVPFSEIILWMNDLYSPALMAHIQAGITFQKIVKEVPDGAGGWMYQDERVFVKNGLSDGDGLPPQNAAVVIGITPSRRRGKKFIPGILELDQNGGNVQATLMGLLNTFGEIWTTPGPGGFPISTFESGVCKPDGSDFLAFTSFGVNPTTGTQVRRKAGRGS